MDRDRSESPSPIRRARSRSVRPRGDADRSPSRPPSVRLVDAQYYMSHGGGVPPPPQPRRSRSRPGRLSGDGYGIAEAPPRDYYRTSPIRETSGRHARRRSRRQYTKEDYGGGGGNRRDSRRVPSPAVVMPMPSEDQDSDNVLDDYYGGQDDDPMGADSGPELERPEALFYERIHRPETRMSGAPPVGAAPGSQAEMEARHRREQELRARMELEEMKRMEKTNVERTKMSRVQEVQKTARRPDYMREPPRGASDKGLWPRAAVVRKRRSDDGRMRSRTMGGGAYEHPAYLGGDEVLTVSLKLMLTRRGERFRGREFRYVRGTWSDIDLAKALQREYRSLKTQKIGWLQKLTSYRCITFVYFLQYHAYPSRRYPDGFWRISARRPVTRLDDQQARSSFMYRLKRIVREGGPGLWGGGKRKDGKVVGSDGRLKPPPREWVDRLDCLIEPGAVLDIEVKETFDTGKIYIGLILAILLSLGAALAYGFATPDQDFSTGFSLASWMITAFGFFAAVVAAGEVLGLEKPSAIMQAGEELSADTKLTRDMLYF